MTGPCKPTGGNPWGPPTPGRSLPAWAIASALVWFATPCRAQVPRVEFDGSEIFCHILKHLKLEPITTLDDYRPDETVIIVFGDLGPLEPLLRQTQNPNDYAWLVASDRPSGGFTKDPLLPQPRRRAESRLAPWRLMIHGVEINQPAESAFQGKPRCPLLQKTLDQAHPIFRGISTGLATNRPSFLVSVESDLHLVATFPDDCFAIDKTDWRRLPSGYIFGSPADSASRTLVLAGHGVFMNGMLAQFHSDNFLFAVNTIRWLRDGPQGKRKYALMIHDGRVIDSFGLPLTAAPQLPMPPVAVINRMLRQLEEERVFQRLLEESVGGPTLLRFVLLLGSSGLLIYGFYRLFLTRHLQENVPLVVGLTPPPLAHRTIAAQRHLELLAMDNLWEPAQALARQWFIDHADIEAPLWDEAPTTPVPQAEYRVTWWKRQKLAQQVRELWSYAVRDPAQGVTRRDFVRLTDRLASLSEARRAGQLVFPRGKSMGE